MKPFHAAAVFLAVVLYSSEVLAVDDITGKWVTFNSDGGWCWFEDERVVITDGRMLIGSVKSPSGDIDVTVYDFASGDTQVVTLHAEFESDDHDSPAFLPLPDGRVLAAYGKHSGDPHMHWRVTSAPGNAVDWEPVKRLHVGAPYSYSNLFRLSEEGGRIYNFHRGVGFNPNYAVSDDGGETFRYGGRLLKWTPADSKESTKGTPLGGGGRPYLKYASDGRDTIHFVTSEDHPRNYDNGIYHGMIRGGRVLASDGTVVGPLSTDRDTDIRPVHLTCVFPGTPERVAWPVDLQLDSHGNPVVLFSLQCDGAPHRANGNAGGEDLRYAYGRWNGTAWQVAEIARAGSRLYTPEVDYSGLGAIDPSDVTRVYISTNADPVTGEPLVSAGDGKRHYEIFRGTVGPDGTAWRWEPLTRDSTADNIRPIVPARSTGPRPLLWLRGTYRTYRDYRLSVVGIPDTDAGER